MGTLPITYSYSRADAIEEAVQISVTSVASEAVFKVPVALTAEVWNDCVARAAEDNKLRVLQDEAGRMSDALWIVFVATQRARGDRAAFQLHRVPRGGHGYRPRLTTLHLNIGPGDEMERVISILLPGHD